MKISPLQLRRYFVSEMSCSANMDFNPSRDFQLSFEQFQVETDSWRTEGASGSWSLRMVITHQIGPQQNFPYEFKLVMIGFLVCTGPVPHGLEEDRYVKVNGFSILYGIAREIIRATTARGPWRDLMIPTVSFFEAARLPEKPPGDQLKS
jgi:hypothetical protein